MTSTGTLSGPRTTSQGGGRRSGSKRRGRKDSTAGRGPAFGGRASRRIVVLVLVLAVLIGAGWLVANSSLLSTRWVSVAGPKTVSPDHIRSAAAVPLGVPLARQDVDAIARRITMLPAIESSRVDRGWPHTVELTVVERTPIIAVRRLDGFLLVDRFGVAYATVDSVPEQVVLTEIYPGTADQFVEVATVATAIPPGLSIKVDKIRAASIDTITVVLKSGLVVTWGNADESALKGEIVLALLKQKPRQIDVSAPHNPSIR